MDVRSHRDRHRVSSRDTTPDRAKMCRLQQTAIKPPSKRVQVVYYLSRNGLLEHPHYVELTLSQNEPLRLKDVFSRLIALRGSGMPLQYSWSCKRNYKSGYVWCDLALNDIIHPAEGAEYVLKGSELVEGCSAGRFQQLHLSANKQAIHQPPDPNCNNNNLNTKCKSFNSSPHRNREAKDQYEEYEEEELYEAELGEERTSFTYTTTSSTTTPHSRCSRGVSTDELLEEGPAKGNKVISTTNKQPQQSATSAKLSKGSKRFDEDAESVPSRNSVLLQLIACGSSGADFKAAKNEARRVNDAGTKGACGTERRVESNAPSSCEAEMIKYVLENPRFRGLMSEEKEYFSGSLVESMKANRTGSEVEPVLQKSNSYNPERSSNLGIEEEKTKVEEKREAKVGVKGKCIPRKKFSKASKK